MSLDVNPQLAARAAQQANTAQQTAVSIRDGGIATTSEMREAQAAIGRLEQTINQALGRHPNATISDGDIDRFIERSTGGPFGADMSAGQPEIRRALDGLRSARRAYAFTRQHYAFGNDSVAGRVVRTTMDGVAATQDAVNSAVRFLRGL